MDCKEDNPSRMESSLPQKQKCKFGKTLFALQFYVRRSKRYNEDGSSEEDSKHDSTSLPSHRLPSSYRGTWPIRRDVWANQQIAFPAQQSTSLAAHNVSRMIITVYGVCVPSLCLRISRALAKPPRRYLRDAPMRSRGRPVVSGNHREEPPLRVRSRMAQKKSCPKSRNILHIDTSFAPFGKIYISRRGDSSIFVFLQSRAGCGERHEFLIALGGSRG